MKRSWIPFLTAAGVIGVLTLFLGLQYSWLKQAGEATRERMQKRVEEDAKRISEDFNREVQAAYFNFQADPERIIAGDVRELSERYEYWKRNTEFPGLISKIVFVPEGDQARAARFDPASSSLVAEAADEPTRQILQQLSAEKHPRMVFESASALVVPLYPTETKVERILIRRPGPPAEEELAHGPEAAAYILVFLDAVVITDQMLPAFSGRHLPGGEFNVTVVDRNGGTVYAKGNVSGTADASGPLFDLTPDNLIFFRREALPRKEGGTAVFSQTIESRTLSKEKKEAAADKSETFTIQMKEGAGERHSAVTVGNVESQSPWKLQLQHSAGSIGRFVEGERLRSMVIGFGVYLLLVGGILAIVVSAHRSRLFAQRQIDFVSSVSHEFRTPLAVIYSAGENLADGVAQAPAQVSKYGELIKGEGKKLSAMVEQILEFAGARSGKRSYKFIEADAVEIVRNALAESSPALESAGFEVETSLPAALPLGKADPDALASAFQNLIQNAVKYGNGTKWMRISASNGGGSVRVTVEDRGIGISRTDQKHVFEPFYRAKDVVDAQIHGNGLGLALVKEVVDAHGGKISVRSEPGRGSEFTIEISQQ